jgi:hypothetical protein
MRRNTPSVLRKDTISIAFDVNMRVPFENVIIGIRNVSSNHRRPATRNVPAAILSLNNFAERIGSIVSIIFTIASGAQRDDRDGARRRRYREIGR